ncbi:tetratricopeptide repeat protein [Flavobacteriales bacterium]|nr:tetratricopeptide repeat protein [Flavobacteriales bacterium]
MRATTFNLTYFIILSFLMTICSVCHSMAATSTDSLEQLLPTITHDSEKVAMLNTIAKANWLLDAQKSIEFSEKAKDLAKQIDEPMLICQALNISGIGYYYLGNLDKATEQLKESINLNRQHNPNKNTRGDLSQKTLASSFNNLGMIAANQGSYDNALSYYLQALSLWKTEIEQANTLGNIGNLFRRQKKYDDALTYYQQALDIRKRVDDKSGVMSSLNNIGILYAIQGDMDSALDNFLKALYTARELNDKRRIAAALGNIGQVYQSIDNDEKALEYLIESVAVAKEMGNLQSVANTLIGIGELYAKQNDWNRAINSQLQGINIAEGAGLKPILQEAYQAVSNNYKLIKDYQHAYEYQSKMIAIKDTLFDEKNAEAMAEMQTKYETEKKEQENELLKTEKQIHEDRNKFLAAGILFVLVALGLVLYQFRLKRKANEKLLVKNKIIRDKNKTIVDSINYAKMIQTAVLPELTTIKSHFPESFLFFKPKDVVSGDFYWMFEKENQVLFAAADCTGHGVPGAFMSLICINLLNEIASNQESPAGILNDMSVRLIQHLKQDASKNSSVNDGLDIALCAFDKKTNKLTFSGAHNPLYLVRDKELTEYKGDRLHIGVHQKVGREFTQTTIEMKQNDIIYLFSDGFPDQPGGVKGKKFYYPPFQKLLLTNHQLPMEQQAGILASTIKEFQSNKGQVDDMLVMGMKF